MARSRPLMSRVGLRDEAARVLPAQHDETACPGLTLLFCSVTLVDRTPSGPQISPRAENLCNIPSTMSDDAGRLKAGSSSTVRSGRRPKLSATMRAGTRGMRARRRLRACSGGRY